MPKICYRAKRFGDASLAILDQAEQIINEMQSQGFTLTLRQLYYQFVARGWIANTVHNYGRLGRIINEGRLAGEIDWNAIEDRTRSLKRESTWQSPQDIIEAAAASYARDKWADQPVYVEVWIEKEALAGVFAAACDPLSVPFFCCRGYPSQSEVWAAGKRFCQEVIHHDQELHILHFGDHDPSGIDMTRDIVDRMRMFVGGTHVYVERLALNMDQVEEHNPPPNPAKMTDSRFADYADKFGTSSWELDALDPPMLVSLVTEKVIALRDEEIWAASVARETEERDQLTAAADDWERIVEELL